jgi:hypothetical protein
MDEKIQKCAIFENKNAIHFYKRFIDDVFMIWTGTVTQFKTFMDKINLLYKTLKFTSEFNKEKNSTTFLDEVDGRIEATGQSTDENKDVILSG